MSRVFFAGFVVLIFCGVMAAQPGGGSMGANGGQPPTPGSQMGDGSRPMGMPGMPMLSGTVVMEDGAAPPAPVVIERVCAGIGRPEARTNEKGAFKLAFTRMAAPGQPPASNDGCSIKAALAGFSSDSADLTGRKPNKSELGKVILHPIEGVKGFTFSKTTKEAPKDARKQFEGSRESLEKNKPDAAEKQIHKAVEIYPAFAEAWQVLGTLQLEAKKPAEAKASFEQALKADPEFVAPYAQLARIAASRNDWQTVVDLTDKCVALNPYYSPEMLLGAALANHNLKKLDVAQTRAEQAIRADEQNALPRARYILGLLEAERGNFKAAAVSLREYLTLFPNTNDAATVKQQLAQIEQRAAATK